MIKPVSLAQNNTYFGIKRLEGGDSYNKSNTPIGENKKTKDFKSGFYLGMVCSAILGVTGMSIYKDNQINDLLQEVMEKSSYSEFKAIKVEDRTKDSIPDLVLVEQNGDETVYDLCSGQKYYNEDGDLIEID